MQGYPEGVIDYGIQKAITKGPFNSRVHEDINTKKVIPFVTTFNPCNFNMYPMAKNKYEELRLGDGRMHKILDKHIIINSKRQPKNLKRILTCSKFDDCDSTDTPKVSKCTTPRCGTCSMITECSTVVFKNGLKFTVKRNMNCKSKNVIYAIICPKCEEFYIGQTGNELRTRMTVHRQQTRSDTLRFLQVNKHMHQCADDTFKVMPLYQMFGSDRIKREIKELELIKILKPGLNR